MAQAILTTAIAEQRCAEFLDCLFNGGSATVDHQTRKLVLIPGSALLLMASDEPSTS
jgi:hypothetical protein